MEVKRDDKQSGRAVNDVDCRGCYEVLVTLWGSEHFLLPTDAHNVKKRRVIKTFWIR